MIALGLLTLSASLLAPAQVDVDVVLKAAHQQAQAAANTVIEEDYEKLVDLTYPKVVEQMGGKAKMVATLKELTKNMKAQGLTFRSSKTERPTRMFRAGRDDMTVVPVTLELSVPDGTLRAQSFLVGISADQGTRWTFVDGNIGEAKIRTILPNMPREMALPQPQKPVLEKKPGKEKGS